MFKDNLKAKRKDRKLSQEDMALSCGMSLSAYKNYESGKSEPTMTNLIKIASTLETSIDELCDFGKTDDMEIGLKMRLQKIMTLNNDEKKAVDLLIQSVILKHQAEETHKLFNT
ncbi:helix-turn-helix domain-containing protein [Vibrio sp. 10N.261.46.A3]|uniref:helix-turn-helix domain-containing protein n=1 Tax=Vibrio sp. 10N.261.46.A3 TaxID=3229658 RepID=UPI003551597C